MRWLAIGIGNTLRRDDGIGPWLAERIEEWRLPGIRTKTVHQLTPEIAAEIAEANAVLFLDASAVGESELRRVVGHEETALGHAMSPSAFLAMLHRIGVSQPPAWLASVRATDFDFGEGLSSASNDECERLLPAIRGLLLENSACTKSA